MRRNIDADPSQTWLAIRFQNKPRAGTNFVCWVWTFTKIIQFKPAFTWTNPSLIVAMQFTIHAKHPRSSATISFKKDGWPSLTWASWSFDAYDNFPACDLSMFTTRYYKYSILFLFFSCSCLRLSNWFGHFKAMLLGKFQTFLIQRHKLSTSNSETKNGGNKSVYSSLMFISWFIPLQVGSRVSQAVGGVARINAPIFSGAWPTQDLSFRKLRKIEWCQRLLASRAA